MIHRTRLFVFATLVCLTAMIGGCVKGPTLLTGEQQVAIDRKLVEFPAGFELRPYITGLTTPVDFEIDAERSLLIAEGGTVDIEPRIFGFKKDGEYFQVYPSNQRLPFGIIKTGFRMYGPVGGMVVHQNKIYVSHRDEHGKGVITAFNYDGSHITIAADLPAQGDYGVTDIAVHSNGRLYFGVGTATNSGVVGLDNFERGWVKRNPTVCDSSWIDLKLLGYRFDTPNPQGGLFGGDDISVTAPFQPFGTSKQTRILSTPNHKPNGAIYSVSATGGDLRVEAHGIRMPRGLAFTEYNVLYATNNGMEMRGTRPVKDDPDAMLRIISGTWYGWPDYSTDLRPISEPQFQPPVEMLIKTGYPDLSALINHDASGLLQPVRDTLLRATFDPLAGASKMDFAPGSGPFREYEGSAIVALSGDRAPFATSGHKLARPVGFKVVLVDLDSGKVQDFIRNTAGIPASRIEKGIVALERPYDVKFGPDGSLYVLDFGRLELKNGRDHVGRGTGRIFRLIPIEETKPAEAAPAP
jgi:glucose/arabinose dehydrogenase